MECFRVKGQWLFRHSRSEPALVVSSPDRPPIGPPFAKDCVKLALAQVEAKENETIPAIFRPRVFTVRSPEPSGQCGSWTIPNQPLRAHEGVARAPVLGFDADAATT